MGDDKEENIVDVDAGSDDAVALLLLLTFEEEKNFQIVGITCTHGNTSLDYVYRNVLLTLETISRLDIPVFRGAEQPLITLKSSEEEVEHFHGKDGFGDCNFERSVNTVQTENAVVALNRIAAEFEEGIDLICLGPLTNIALAFRTYSGFSNCINHMFLMGGNTKGIGNIKSAAEFNFYKDPEAAHIVLSSASCPITILPWEPCLNFGIPLEERLNGIGKILTAHIKLLNTLERKTYKNLKVWNPCDAFLAAAYIDEAVIEKFKTMNLSVELFGIYTRGQGVVDHCGTQVPNVKVIEKIDIEIFRKLVYKMATFSPK